MKIDLSIKGLFPNINKPDEDKKCIIIGKVINELSKVVDMSNMTQESLQENAKKRYDFLSKEERLSLPDADHKAFLLYKIGVSSKTAQEYFSFRLTENDAKKWKILEI